MKLSKIIKNKIIFKNNYEKCFIIGASPSKNARSPKLWNYVYKKFKIQREMYPVDLDKKNIRSFFKIIKKDKSFKGLLITIPFKEISLKYVDKVSLLISKINSINTIVKKNKLEAFNTDYLGAIESLKKIRLRKKNQKVLVVGSGGTGKTIMYAVNNFLTNSKIYLMNRTSSKSIKILNKLKLQKKNSFFHIKKYDDLFKIDKFDLLINCTSVGFDNWFKENNLNINLKPFSPLSPIKKINGIKSKNFHLFVKKNKLAIKENQKNTEQFLKKNKKIKVFDVIYNPAETILLKKARENSINNFNGLYMNLVQAAKAFVIVNGLGYKKVLNIMKSYG